MQISVATKSKKYPIYIYRDFTFLPETLVEHNFEKCKKLIVTDDRVAKHYLQDVISRLEKLGGAVDYVVIPAGERSKNLQTIEKIYEKLISFKADRKTCIFALGGGVIGDMAGFAAATYMRGVPYIQLPTTLLSQVDSSVGGKTGVDFCGNKNMVGAFYQPEMVYMNTGTLDTLPEEEFNNGMAEVIKYGCIMDRDFFGWLHQNKEKIVDKEIDAVLYMLKTCCLDKANIVADDEKETGRREVLNFGHTIGHAIESLMEFKLLHGVCVALGMRAKMQLALKNGELCPDEWEMANQLFQTFSLNQKIDGLTPEEIYRQMQYDKKAKEDKITLILLKGIGDCYRTNETGKEMILSAIASIISA